MNSLRTFNKNVRIRLYLNFFAIVTSTMVMPYTVVYFSNKIGPALTTSMILLIGIISIIGYILGGIITDRLGRKKIIVFSEMITGIGFIVISYFDSLEVFYMLPILLSFSIIYFFETAANPAYSALLIDSSEDEYRKTMYSYFMWMSSVAFALGSLIGGFFFENYSQILYFLVGVTSLISAIFTSVFIKDFYYEKIQKKEIGQQKRVAFNNKTNSNNKLKLFSAFFILLYLGSLLINLLSEQFPNYISVRIVSNYPISESVNITGYNMISILNLENTLITALVTGLIIKLTKKLSDKSNLIFGLILFISGYVLLSYFVHPIFLVLGMFLIAIGRLIYNPTLQTIVANAIPENTRGTVLSILGLMGALGGTLSGLFIWGSTFISEKMITCIFIGIGLTIIFIYINAYKIYKLKEDKQSKEKVFKSSNIQ